MRSIKWIRGIDYFLLLLVLIFAAYLFPFIKPGFYESHDGENHVARFGAYYKAFADGQIPPRFAKDLNFGYGTPVLNFFYPLPGYIGSLLFQLGITLEDCFKLLSVASFILAPFFLYIWSRTLFKDRFAAFFSALLYGLAPYHVLDLYVRGDIGELLAFIFIPLVFFSVDAVAKNRSIVLVLLGSISLAFLILSHNVMSLVFFLLVSFYAFFRIWQAKTRAELTRFLLLSMILGFGLAAFFWIPALFESRFTSASRLVGDIFRDHFPSIASLFYSAWGFGSDVNKPFGLSPQIGPMHWGVVFIAAILVLFKKKFTLEKLFWFFVFAAGVFMTLSLSAFIWDTIPLLKLFQFPWRFTAISSFAAAILGGFVILSIKRQWIRLGLLGVFLILSFSYLDIKPQNTKSDAYYLSFPGTTFYHGEATTIWTAGDYGSFPQKHEEVISGKARIESIARKSNEHRFTIHAETDAQILDNTVYFPGWQVHVDGKKVPIEFQDINYRGLIKFPVLQGVHSVVVHFGESPIRLVSDIITMASIFTVFILWFARKKIERNFHL